MSQDSVQRIFFACVATVLVVQQYVSGRRPQIDHGIRFRFPIFTGIGNYYTLVSERSPEKLGIKVFSTVKKWLQFGESMTEVNNNFIILNS